MADTEQTMTLKLDPEAQAQMADLQAKLDLAEKERERAEAVAVQQAAALSAAQARIGAIEAEAQRRRLTDLVMGRGGSGDGRRWYGSVEAHVAHLIDLAAAFPEGEDSAPFKHYVDLNRAHAEQLHTSGLFREIGTTGETGASTGSAAERFEAKVQAHLAAHKTDYDAAFRAVQAAEPDLAREYADAVRHGGR